MSFEVPSSPNHSMTMKVQQARVVLIRSKWNLSNCHVLLGSHLVDTKQSPLHASPPQQRSLPAQTPQAIK